MNSRSCVARRGSRPPAGNYRTGLAILIALVAVGPLTAANPTNDASAEFPYVVPFELGKSQFAPGDNITITQLRGTSPKITPTQTYIVSGTYRLNSSGEARLAFFATTPDSGPTPVDPRQTTRVTKGSGSFCLIKTLRTNGYLHLSFYPTGSGNDLGGVYFGQGDWVLREKTKNRPETPATASGPNRRIFDYLGEPVSPPRDLKAAYTREGLLEALQRAARQARVTLEHIEIDTSEFPFLIGVVCRERGALEKLTEQIRQLQGYTYPGSISSSTRAVFNIVPYRAFPPESAERINHRLGVREQILFDQISRQR